MKFISAAAAMLLICSCTDALAYVRKGKSFTATNTTQSINTGSVKQYIGFRLIDSPSTKIKDIENEKFSFSNYFGGSISYGLKSKILRGEIELKKTTTSKYHDQYVVDSEDIKLDFLDLMLNCYLDLNIHKKLSGFITIGAGMEHVNSTADLLYYDPYYAQYLYYQLNDKDDSFAYQVGLGLTYNITHDINIDFGYRYITTAKNVYDFTLYHQELFVGARYLF